MDDFLKEIENDARNILQASNERRLKAAKGVRDTLPSPSAKKQNAPVSSQPLSPSELSSLSKKAIALSSPKRQPLVPSTRPVEPAGITSGKVLRGLSSSSASSPSAASSSSPFLGSPIKLDPPKKKTQSSKQKKGRQGKSGSIVPASTRPSVTKNQMSSSLGSTGSDKAGGPVELDIEILRKKYRCEKTRSEAHKAYLKRTELRSLVNGNDVGGPDGESVGDCLVVAEDETPVEKHPIQARVEELVERENDRASERSRRKLESNAWEVEVRKECLSELDKLRSEEGKAMHAVGKGDNDTETAILEEYDEPPEPLGHDIDAGSSVEDIIRNPSPNLSMKLAAGELHELPTLIPGCTAIGPVGGLHRTAISKEDSIDTDQSDNAALRDRTQAVACFTRDPTTSAPKVTIAQAIETPMFAEPTIAFDPTQIKPPPAEHEEPSGVMPEIYPPNNIIDRNPLVSPIAEARPSTVVILDPNATEEDYASAIIEDAGDDSDFDGGPRVQHRRHLEEVTPHGFPTKCYAAPFEVDTSAVTHDVGITEEGITMPEPAVSGMVKCVSGKCTTESLSKEKTPLDFLYIAKDPNSGKDGGSPNEGSLFTVLMNKYEIASIVRTTERKQQAEQDQLRDAQAENRRKAEMAAKIKAATELMERRLAAEREKILREEAPGGHKTGESTVDAAEDSRNEPLPEEDGEEAWERRMKCSVIVTIRDLGDSKWEERQLMDSKRRFYRNVDPCLILSDAASWNPPTGWDLVALPVPDIGDCDNLQLENQTRQEERETSSDEASKEPGDEDDDIGRLATLLTRNDEFVKTMAARLGVPEDKVRSLGENVDGTHVSDDAKANNNHKDPLELNAPHNDNKTHEDLTALPQGYADVYAIKCAERSRQQLVEGTENIDPRDRGGGVRGYEWRKLPRAIIGADFFHHNKRKVQSCADESFYCQPNKPQLVGLVDPVKGIQREVDENEFQTELTTLFISDIKTDRFKIVEDQKKQNEQEESLLNASQQEALEQILNLSVDDGAGSIAGDTGGEMAKSPDGSSTKTAARQQTEVIDLQGKSNAELTLAAVDAVKSSNYGVLEHILDEIGLSVNCRDEHGNTLLIIAAQRASKRMVKFLLRRNANMNAQNFVGCTALHYLYGYGHDRLAEYLLSKGASDEVINKAGLTVYEGLEIDSE